MNGRGWFVIYGVLLLMVIFLFISQLGANAKIDQLQTEVKQLKGDPVSLNNQTATPTPEPTPSSDVDLSTPEARDEKRVSDLDDIRSALADYQKENKTYPATIADLGPKYLDPLPADPLNPKFTYRYRQNGRGFLMTAKLETKGVADDTEDGKADQIYTLTEKSEVIDGSA